MRGDPSENPSRLLRRPPSPQRGEGSNPLQPRVFGTLVSGLNSAAERGMGREVGDPARPLIRNERARSETGVGKTGSKRSP